MPENSSFEMSQVRGSLRYPPCLRDLTNLFIHLFNYISFLRLIPPKIKRPTKNFINTIQYFYRDKGKDKSKRDQDFSSIC